MKMKPKILIFHFHRTEHTWTITIFVQGSNTSWVFCFYEKNYYFLTVIVPDCQTAECISGCSEPRSGLPEPEEQRGEVIVESIDAETNVEPMSICLYNACRFRLCNGSHDIVSESLISVRWAVMCSPTEKKMVHVELALCSAEVNVIHFKGTICEMQE